MKSDLLKLQTDLASDRRVLERCLETLARLQVTADSDAASCALASLTLLQTYTAVENVLRRIGAAFEGASKGDNWHRDLLSSMSLGNDFRPLVVSKAVADSLGELLAFRHYLIHGSLVMSPDGERLSHLHERALSLRPQLASDLDLFDKHLVMLINAAED